MEKWLNSVHSDGSRVYVSNPEPSFMELVNVKISISKHANVKSVLLRSVHNGGQEVKKMEEAYEKHGLKYYSADLLMNEPSIEYQFYIVLDDVVYYYTQKGITTYIPDETYNFKLLTEYRSPAWVKNSVFYQIFPERFWNGNKNNDVRDNEYKHEGYATIAHKNWDEPALCYDEGHCADFFGGDLEGITEKVTYLKKLGVDAVYLNPIFKAPSNHKYDCGDYLHVDEHFGGDEALAELCRVLHENNMKVMLDISINHTGREHVWFKEKEHLYVHEKDGSVRCWANVKSLPQLDYTKEELRQLVYKAEDSVLKKWLKPPYSIDGWRFDVADVFARYDNIQLSHEIWPEIRKSIKEENESAYILAEDWSDCPTYLQGKEWDSPMNYAGCGRPLRQFAGAMDLFNERTEELRNVNYKMTAKDLSNRIMGYLAKLPFTIWLNQFNLINSHDVSRIEHYKELNRDELRGISYIQFMLPGTPCIYYGDEAGIDGVTGEDYGARFPMPFNKNIEDTDSYKFVKRLIELKKEMKCMNEGSFKVMYDEGYVFSVARFTDEEIVVSVMSTSEKQEEIEIELNSIGGKTIEKEVFGKKIDFVEKDGILCINVPPHEAYIFTCSML